MTWVERIFICFGITVLIIVSIANHLHIIDTTQAITTNKDKIVLDISDGSYLKNLIDSDGVISITMVKKQEIEIPGIPELPDL